MSGDSEVRCVVVTIHGLFVLMPVVIFLVVRGAIRKLERRVWTNPLRRPLSVVYSSLRGFWRLTHAPLLHVMEVADESYDSRRSHMTESKAADILEKNLLGEWRSTVPVLGRR
jgi:hypothetical protein